LILGGEFAESGGSGFGVEHVLMAVVGLIKAQMAKAN
jgi:hypothetical protein